MTRKQYKPAEFGRLINRSVKTLQKWDRDGVLKAYRTKTNRRFYTHEQYLECIGQKATGNDQVVAYYRVSSASQKTDLENQRKALEQFCLAGAIPIDHWISDVGSGLNYSRKGFVKLFDLVESGAVKQIVVAHKDRLVRFGYEWFEYFCKKHGTTITVINHESLSPQEEMTKDLLSIIHCFSSRLYGLRRYKKKLREIVHAKPDENNS